MTSPIALGLIKHDIGFQIALTARAVRAAFRPRRASGSATPSGWFSALVLIDENRGISQRELARTLWLDPSVIVGIIDDLERQGLVQRERVETDRRRTELKVTPKGTEMLAEVRQVSQAHEAIVAACLTASEREQLVMLLEKVREAVPPA